MKISAALVVIVLLALPHSMVAQRGGGGRRGGGGGGASPSAGADPNTLKDFNRAIAIQATDQQRADFTSLFKSTEAARRRASELANEKANPTDSTQIAALRDAINETQGTQEHLLGSFSEIQKSGLKDFTKKLGKADSAVLKAMKVLEQDNKKIANSAEKLEEALASLQTEQQKLADEMGIPATPGKTAAN